MLTKQERQILRTLAERYMYFAEKNSQKEKRELWRSLNERRMQRPMVTIDQIPWHEMDVDGSLKLQVQDPYWHYFEMELRQTLYKCEHMPADMVLPPVICLTTPTTGASWGVYGLASNDLQTDATSDIHSRAYECQFSSMEDVQKIQMPYVKRDVTKEALLREEAHLIFDGVAPFVFSGSTGMHSLIVSLWDRISEWMGVTDCYYAIYDNPEMLHAMMRRMTDGIIGYIRQMNEQGLFDVTHQCCHCSMTFTDNLPASNIDPEHATSKDAWIFGMAQLFSSVSPEITEEFEIPYMQEVFALAGAGYYGCCEPLDDRLELIERIPNVRKVSCSAWCNPARFAEKAAHRFVMSCKPTPAVFSVDAFDMDVARKDVRRYLDAAKEHGTAIELIMKDISTVRYEPQRLWAWEQMIMEEVSR